jgi:hypothetical protein
MSLRVHLVPGVILGIAIGLAIGVGAYTFVYARGYSYGPEKRLVYPWAKGLLIENILARSRFVVAPRRVDRVENFWSRSIGQ